MKVDILSADCTERLGNRLWVRTEPFIFSIDGEIFIIPRGTVHDGGSVPRLLWVLSPPMSGPFAEAFGPHDYFYSVDGPDVGRLRADLILYHMGLYRRASTIEAQVIKSGVNLFGWMSYKKGRDKMTAESCYNFVQARLRVAQLSAHQSSGCILGAESVKNSSK